jgi:hypothetical protein
MTEPVNHPINAAKPNPATSSAQVREMSSYRLIGQG